MTCKACRRQVVAGHQCDGDARSTCSIFGCGRPIAKTRRVEVDGTGRTALLGRCAGHPFEEESQ